MVEETQAEERQTIEREMGKHVVRATVATQFLPQLDDIMTVLNGQQEHLYDGYVLSFGWGFFILEKLGDDDVLTLRIPDYPGDASNARTTDLTSAIAIQISQMWLPRACGLRMQHLDFHQDILLEKGWEEWDSFSIYRRATRVDRYSGWFARSLEDIDEDPVGKDQIVDRFAWQVIQRHPQLAQVLLLPDDTGVMLKDGSVYQVVDLDDDSVLYDRDRDQP